MHHTGILMHMRTTLNIDDALLGRATELSGLREKTAVVRAGLEALVARESARRLAALGGTDRGVRAIPRRRPRPWTKDRRLADAANRLGVADV